eukprot:6213540-Pleurochrysis_carterae.AAC.1
MRGRGTESSQRFLRTANSASELNISATAMHHTMISLEDESVGMRHALTTPSIERDGADRSLLSV